MFRRPSNLCGSPVLVDPLAQVVTLLQPRAPLSKVATGAGRWRVRRSRTGLPFYCAVLEGTCRIHVNGHDVVTLKPGDFVLIPASPDFAVSSLEPPGPGDPEPAPVRLATGEVRSGTLDAPAEVRLLIGYCEFGSPDAALLVSLLPRLIHVRGDARLATIQGLVGDEIHAAKPARNVVLERLLEVLLIEALRSTAGTAASPGLLRGLADERVAAALRRMHDNPAHPWTVPLLAAEAALSRSAFFDRFRRTVGAAPMDYLLAWRLALAKESLRRGAGSVASIAEQVGYASASTFTIAFSREVGMPPTRYAREHSMVSTALGKSTTELSPVA